MAGREPFGADGADHDAVGPGAHEKAVSAEAVPAEEESVGRRAVEDAGERTADGGEDAEYGGLQAEGGRVGGRLERGVNVTLLLLLIQGKEVLSGIKDSTAIPLRRFYSNTMSP